MNEVISNKIVSGSEAAFSKLAGQISLAAAAASLIFLATLHVLSPEFDPSRRMVSEYALGNHGWALLLMFLAWALGCVALFFAVKSQVRTIGGKIGLGLLLVAALGMTMGGVFDVNHNLHRVAAMIGMPTLPIAAVLISVSLLRNPAWAPARRSLLWAAHLTWISLLLMTAGVFTGFSSTGETNPDAWFGWANRLLIVAYNIWLLVVARRAVETIE
ncbi:MAG TPA: DUF998 domain-containing protein [Anaerolineales bacterium]|nr:DUF998 domain-containing protein [Anaerolineales bacterium]